MSLHSFAPHFTPEVIEVRRRRVSVTGVPGEEAVSLVVDGDESSHNLLGLREDLEQALLFVERLLQVGVHVDTRQHRHDLCDRSGVVERS